MTDSHLMRGAAPVLPTIPSIESVLAAHGAGKVLRAALLALLRGQGDPEKALVALPDHLRRDIGLPRSAAPPADSRDLRLRQWP
ncbi:hypothetical protein [Phaeovulum sp. W22_SRMD_FR3]|uniref:hypothetical protein n=1 Tax=Phaeovulum sp. W22_SRMD_FR3 TaxID=3240274 RepID=UPI003F9E8123